MTGRVCDPNGLLHESFAHECLKSSLAFCVQAYIVHTTRNLYVGCVRALGEA